MAAAKKASSDKTAPKKKKAKPTKPSQAAKLVEAVPEAERLFAETLVEVAFAMKEKLEQKLEQYSREEFVQTVTSTQGDKVQKQNPFVSEFRATARDYAAIVKELHDTLGGQASKDNLESLNDFRKKYNIV